MSKAVQRRRGTTAEHTTFTGALGELTVDTTKDTVVVHDGAAAGGFPLLREDGSNSALAIGSAGTPSLKFTGDPNTGLYSPGADQVAISTGGTGRLFVDASGNVGIGTSTPNTNNYGGSVLGLFAASNAGGNIWLSSDASTSGNRTGRIGFGTTSNTSQETARIWSLTEGSTASNLGGNLVFNTKADAGGLSERARITSDGKFGLGTSSPAQLLHVSGSGTQAIRVENTLGTGNASIELKLTNNTFTTSVNNTSIFYNDTAGREYIWYQNSVERLRIDSSGRLLVGTSTSKQTNGAKLEIVGSRAANGIYEIALHEDAIHPLMTFSKGAALVSSGDGLGEIGFFGHDGTDKESEAARITAFVDGTPNANDMPGRLVFSTTANGAALPTERMRITSTGHVGIGASSPTGLLTIGEAAASTYTDVSINGATTANYGPKFGLFQGGTEIFEIANYGRVQGGTSSDVLVETVGSNKLQLGTNRTVAATIDTSQRVLIGTTSATANGGVLQVSNGITFPATQSACSDANTLDDYEEGTWTPTVGGTATYTTQYGKYTKIGDTVFVQCKLIINILGTGSASTISGLPFNPSTSGSLFGISIGYFESLALTPVMINGQLSASAITFSGLTAANASITGTFNILGNSARVDFTATYNV